MSSCALGRQCWTRLEAWQVFCPLRSLEEDQALRRDPIRVKEVQHLMKLLKPARSMASAQRSPLWHLAHKYKVSAYLSPNDVFGPKNRHLPAFGSGGVWESTHKFSAKSDRGKALYIFCLIKKVAWKGKNSAKTDIHMEVLIFCYKQTPPWHYI